MKTNTSFTLELVRRNFDAIAVLPQDLEPVADLAKKQINQINRILIPIAEKAWKEKNGNMRGFKKALRNEINSQSLKELTLHFNLVPHKLLG